MLKSDKAKLTEALAACAIVFDKEMNEPLIEAYFIALQEFPIDAVCGAFIQAMKTKTFFPKPAELRESLEGNGDDRANQAWMLVCDAVADPYASVKFLDPATASAIDAVFGSWALACRAMSSAEEPMVAHYRKAFHQSYVTARKFPRDVETYRAGIAEATNRAGGGYVQRIKRFFAPVQIIGFREIKTLRLPFDAETGRLTAEAQALLNQASNPDGARALIEYARGQMPQTALGDGMPKIEPATGGELTAGESKQLLKMIEAKTGVSLIKPIETGEAA